MKRINRRFTFNASEYRFSILEYLQVGGRWTDTRKPVAIETNDGGVTGILVSKYKIQEVVAIVCGGSTSGERVADFAKEAAREREY